MTKETTTNRPYPPTLTQLYVLHAIHDLTAAEGRPPSYGEIAAELDYPNKSRVYAICEGLRDRGWLKRRAWGMRGGLVLTQEPPPLPEPEIEITDLGRGHLLETAARA